MPNKTKTAKKPNHGPTKRIYSLLSQHLAHTDTTKFKKGKDTSSLKKETSEERNCTISRHNLTGKAGL